MAIGRSFGEAVQKALRMLEVGADGFDPNLLGLSTRDEVLAEISPPSSRRILPSRGRSQSVFPSKSRATNRNRSFLLHELFELHTCAWVCADCRFRRFRGAASHLQASGFFRRGDCGAVRRDSGRCSSATKTARDFAEAAADRHAGGGISSADQLPVPDLSRRRRMCCRRKKETALLGSGCYRIGSSVEFDWSCVGAAQAARELAAKLRCSTAIPRR